MFTWQKHVQNFMEHIFSVIDFLQIQDICGGFQGRPGIFATLDNRSNEIDAEANVAI